MLRYQSYKFELRPNGQQARKMVQFAGSCRFVYNKALETQMANTKNGGTYISYRKMSKLLTAWRHEPETRWLADTPCALHQQKVRDVDSAYLNFFAKRSRFPRFKKKGCDNDRFRFPDRAGIKLDQVNGRIRLTRLGWVRYRKSRDVSGEVRYATVMRSGDKWFIAITTRLELSQPGHPAGPMVGIDMGIVRFATLSDGTYSPPINSLRAHEAQLRRAQRSQDRKKLGSNNWKRQKARVGRIHAHIAACRHDFLHKLSSEISKSHAIVCIEDLTVQNMTRSALGTRESPGRNVRAKSCLNKAILDQGWGTFRRQLGYKLEWNGGKLIAVPPRNTSRTCPECKHVSKDNRRTQAQFRCVLCGFEANADLVGALNVLAAGHAVLACGGAAAVRPPMKQEPTEIAA